jgi:hypothetical protein
MSIRSSRSSRNFESTWMRSTLIIATALWFLITSLCCSGHRQESWGSLTLLLLCHEWALTGAQCSREDK